MLKSIIGKFLSIIGRSLDIATFILQDISQEERTALSIVSYVGCGISIVCLLAALIILVYYRLVLQLSNYYYYILSRCHTCDIQRDTLFKGIHNFIHMNLVIALLCALITFVSGIETATDSEVRHYYKALQLLQLVHL